MSRTMYSKLYSLMEKGDVERRTILSPFAVALFQDGELKYHEGEGDWDKADVVETIKAEPHLVIFGGGHVSKAIADNAHLLSMKVTVIDERSEMANRERFTHGEEIIVESYSSFFNGDHDFFRPYYIIVTHGHIHDKAALRWCLGKKYAYLGMIGSKGKVAKTFAALEEEGISEDLLSTVHAPIGLPIGAVTPEEIAISILSEIIQVFRETKYSVTLDPQYLKKASEDQGVAARIIDKSGSAPRAVGSEIFIPRSGEVYGTVGGGKVEKETIDEARRMLEDGSGEKTIHYNLSAASDLGMICGGDVTILFTRVS